jgi:pre-mRNA-splicing factor 38A
MNRTVKGAKLVHGKDPQLLVEKITRDRIFDSRYWKENCFGLNVERLTVLAADLDHVGGTYANQKPMPFLCLTLRLLQLQPSEDVLMELIRQEDFKYLRVLVLFYWRLVGSPATRVYTVLEPYLADRRKIRVRLANGTFALDFVDAIVDQMLRHERVFSIILPRLQSRMVLEEAEEIGMRESLLDEIADEEIEQMEEMQAGASTTKSKGEPIAGQDTGGATEELSLEATNALRAQLGLKPLSS